MTQATWLNSYRRTISRALDAGATSLLKQRSTDYDELDKAFADGGWRLMQFDAGHYGGQMNLEDVDFIERVRTTGSVGSESVWSPESHKSPAEEMTFWLHPWCSEETGVPVNSWRPTIRRVAKEAAALAADARRAAERRMTKAALEEARQAHLAERARLSEERERRILQTMLADLEWESTQPKTVSGSPDDNGIVMGSSMRIAAPRNLSSSIDNPSNYIPIWKTSRHYIPFWKRDEILFDRAWEAAHEENAEQDRAAIAIAEHEARYAARNAARKAAADMRLHHDADAHVRAWRASHRRQERFLQHINRVVANKAQAESERLRRVAHVAAIKQENDFALAQYDAEMVAKMKHERTKNRAALKGRILSVVRGTGVRVWTVSELMLATGAHDRIEFLECCNELVGDGYIHPGPVNPPSGARLR
jgi:hypothetical protein